MKRLTIAIVLGIWLSVSAQQACAQREVMFAHYMYNTQDINPAYVGHRKSFSVTSLNRSHWTLVFDRAPMSQSLNIHTPTSNEKIGLGLAFRNEIYGRERTTSFYADVSYHVKLTWESSLSMGLKSGLSMYSIPLTELIIDDPADPAFAANYQSHWLPNFGFGLYYQSDWLYLGLSIPKFLEVNYFNNTIVGGARTILQERNYYFIGGGVIRLNPEIDLVPTTYIRFQHNRPMEADLTANFILFDKFSLGAMFRIQDALGLLMGMRINENWTVGYSFDWSILNRNPSFNFGSHEIVLRYDMILNLTPWRRGPGYF
jgi:type IX secretion system PorP/SprF family membrane protein